LSTASEIPRFLGLPAEAADPETAAVAILPVPYDRTSTWKKGADRGPEALLEASTQVELYDIETASQVWQQGIATLAPVLCSGPPEDLVPQVELRVGEVLDRGQLPVVLGGEHSVTIGAVFAAADRFADLSVLQIDAHADTRDSYEGSRFNHACVMARARDRCPIVQVGIRSLDVSELAALDRDRIFFAHTLEEGKLAWMDQVVARLTERVYLTIDLDAFDPSLLPATGTPEPGGLSWRTVNELVRKVARDRQIVGFDVVELLPSAGQHASAFVAAKLVYRILSMVLSQRQG
jgi:agmatinase